MPKPPNSRPRFAIPTGAQPVNDLKNGPDADASPSVPPEDLQAVLDALLLVGGVRGVAGLMLWLDASGARKHGSDRPYNAHDLKQALEALERQRIIKQAVGRGYVVDLRAHAERLQALLQHPDSSSFWLRLVWVFGGGHGDPTHLPHWLGLRNTEEMEGLLRLFIFSGVTAAEFQRLLGSNLAEISHLQLLPGALLRPWMPEAVEKRVEPSLRDLVLGRLLDTLAEEDPLHQGIHQWMEEQFTRDPASMGPGLRGRMAQRHLLALDFRRVDALLEGMSGPGAGLFDGAKQAALGHWAEAGAQFEQSIKEVRQQAGVRRGVITDEMGRLYVLSLLAQPDPKVWEAARRFCIGESGSRSPSPYEWWGLFAHVIGARLGETSLEPNALAYAPGMESREHAIGHACNRLLLAAWLGKQAPAWKAESAQAVLQALQHTGQHWMASWLAAAMDRLEFHPIRLDLGRRRAPASFLGARREPWRDALAAITALVGDKAAKPAATAAPELAWKLTLDNDDRVVDLEPLERSTSARGVPKLKPVTLSKLKKNGAANPRDDAVVRYIERDVYSSTNYHLDVTKAVVALIGHPAVMFADAPGQWVELVEAQPGLEVLRREGRHAEAQFEFKIQPRLINKQRIVLSTWVHDQHAEEERRNELLVLRDGPQQARVIRISPTQRRVAELVAQGWTVPASATAELSSALQVLSGHFQLHSDADAGQLVDGDSRLRARLVPLGDGLQLQLVAQPFGAFGPAVTPGHGRARLMCLHEGLSLATERDLAAEAAHRTAVLEALPFLDPEMPPESPWLLSDPEEALRAVELLPQQAGIAGLDWPKGKPLRVTPLASERLKVEVSSGRDWLAVTGEAQLDEQRLMSLQQLMALARASRSRFVRLGEGDYLALSEQLRQQLRDLDALGQAKKDQLQLPQASASWLDDTLAGMQVGGDKPWRVRMDALAAASALQPALPPGFRAELRGYQMDGYAWMARLAQAGLGACLADDMGLGKTVQTLALLVARAALGPALVLAPTSVCGNWLAEAAVFAPGLQCRLYGEDADRAALVAQAGPGDIIVLSYALAQIDGELLADKPWATLVMDEAQALKNAATKRAKSVAEFKADFRLALSGTPVENRLADLWSIMNLVNPGLLGSAPQFAERFATPIERHQDQAARLRLRRLVSPFLLRRTKTQVLQDLPPRTEIVHKVQPGTEEKLYLEALRRDAEANVAAAAADKKVAPIQVLAELMRLRRAACDPRLVSPELGLVGAKLGEFERIVRELVAGSHKALVFSQFTDYLKLLAERLDSMGLAYQTLDGSTPAAERTKRVAAFQRGEGEVFLISLKAGGFGLNLTMADYVLIVDPWWNPAAEDQATGRAHRMGQQRPVTVYRLVTAGSVEERIIDLHRDKRGLADGILEGQDEATVLDAKAMAELLRG